MNNIKPLLAMVLLGALLFLALLLAQRSLQESSSITLPPQIPESDTSENSAGSGDLNILTITPETVQAAIATLSRPAAYLRTNTVTLYWIGGESTTTVQVAVNGSTMRTETTLKDGTVCHTILVNDTCAVWYDDEQNWVAIRADQFSADILQRMPTYETVLSLPTNSIVSADYCMMDSSYCIHIETAPDEEGYAESYWISTHSGLLIAAERTCRGDVIYRFRATEPTGETPSADLFLLPDGSKLQP